MIDYFFLLLKLFIHFQLISFRLKILFYQWEFFLEDWTYEFFLMTICKYNKIKYYLFVCLIILKANFCLLKGIQYFILCKQFLNETNLLANSLNQTFILSKIVFLVCQEFTFLFFHQLLQKLNSQDLLCWRFYFLNCIESDESYPLNFIFIFHSWRQKMVVYQWSFVLTNGFFVLFCSYNEKILNFKFPIKLSIPVQ